MSGRVYREAARAVARAVASGRDPLAALSDATEESREEVDDG